MFKGRTAAPLAVFGQRYARWRTDLPNLTPLQLMDRILADIDYESYLDTSNDEGLSRWENVLELRRLASEYEDRGLMAFLEDIALISDQDTLDETGSVPTLLTLHAAKGLEFPIVFIVGLEDGTLPHIRSFDDPEAMEEERRLLYVGVTRAKDALFLVNAQNRTAFGYAEATQPSRFLADIPDDLLNGSVRIRRSSPISRESAAQLRWDDRNGAAAAAARKFAAGMKVRHDVWGDGMVLNSRLEGGDETVDIFFEQIGLKRLAASLAKLDIMER
jgi:DNA helicase-2/ATP-dependent DNA helicase PcrA